MSSKISALTVGVAAATDRWPIAISPFGSGDNRYLTHDLLGTYFGKNAFAAGTLTTSQPSGLTQTWNDGAVTFTGWKLNVTDTASAAASLLMDLQVGSTAQFKVSKTGNVTLNDKLYFGLGTSVFLEYVDTATLDIGLNTGGGGIACRFSTDFLNLTGSIGLRFWSTAGSFSGLLTTIIPEAVNTVAQRNGTAAQISNLYDTWASSTDYHRLALKTARATLSGVTGASVTATNLIPDGAVLVGVTTKVTTGLGVSGGTTGYTVGDGTDVDRWGAIVGTAAGTSSDNRDWTATTVQAFIAANNVVITASGGNFDGTGVIYVSVQYLIGEAD